MAQITQRFIDTLLFHKDHPGAEDLDADGIAHVEIDQSHANHVLDIITRHNEGKTSDEECKQELLDCLEHDHFAPHETMSKTMIKNILREDFGVEVNDTPPGDTVTPTM